MQATSRRLAIVFVVSFLSLVTGVGAHAQSVFHPAQGQLHRERTGRQIWVEKCSSLFLEDNPSFRWLRRSADSPFQFEPRTDWGPPDNIPRSCALPQPKLSRTETGDVTGVASRLDTPGGRLPENPCAIAAVPGIARAWGCSATGMPAPDHDDVAAELSTLGKPGARIDFARKQVLGILSSANVCTGWFETKDPAPAATFASLGFLLDRDGPENIFQQALGPSLSLFRQPYVARATQDGGANTHITINVNGAFYRMKGLVVKGDGAGGPMLGEGSQVLRVGSYAGSTLEAQIVTLLHEFGHIVDLLPEDADDMDGKSSRNTDDVVRHCKAEIEASAKQARLSARK